MAEGVSDQKQLSLTKYLIEACWTEWDQRTVLRLPEPVGNLRGPSIAGRRFVATVIVRAMAQHCEVVREVAQTCLVTNAAAFRTPMPPAG